MKFLKIFGFSLIIVLAMNQESFAQTAATSPAPAATHTAKVKKAKSDVSTAGANAESSKDSAYKGKKAHKTGTAGTDATKKMGTHRAKTQSIDSVGRKSTPAAGHTKKGNSNHKTGDASNKAGASAAPALGRAKESHANTSTEKANTNASAKKISPPSRATAGVDKVIGKDAKGRTLYQGPQGGEYYINASGNKEYVTGKQ
jgi:colicin import membrane protein